MNPLLIYGVIGFAAGVAGWAFSKREEQGNDTVSNDDSDSRRGDSGDQLSTDVATGGRRQGRVKSAGPVPRKVTTIKEYQNDEVSPDNESGASMGTDKLRDSGGDQSNSSAEHGKAVRVEGEGDGDEIDETEGKDDAER